MRTYTLHLDRDALPGETHGLERALLVPDGFSWSAFAFGPLWFVFHRLWLAALGVLVLVAGTGIVGHLLGLTPLAGLVVSLLVAFLVGLEASSLRRWTYARRGRPVRDAVIAANVEEAEMKAAARWLDRTPASRPVTPSYGTAPGRPGDVALGMFPLNEGGR